MEIGAAANETRSMKEVLADLSDEMSLMSARASFTQDGPVCFIKGFIPTASLPALEAVALESGWVIIADDPSPEDATPTKVENNRIERMIKPVFDFLGIVPGYAEYEISPWFLGFFTLFTAMIFGDGGYGLIMSLVCAFAFFIGRRKGKAVSDALRLFAFISGMTLLWGLLTATWFSLKAEQLPPALRHIAIWAISSENPAASKNIQVLCFVIGAIQLSIARIKNTIRDFPDLKFLSQLGALALIWGMFFLVLNLVVDSKRFPLPPFCVWLIAGGFAASLIFGAYEGNILKSLLEGLKNIIPTFLSSVGVFADIVSYIRLWALGLAGSSLAAIINTMGGGMLKPALMALAGILILVLGHALNLVLSVLSVVVHAIRLNVLEFSCNHLGMQWSGIKYEPFASRERS
jgi:V/A-type H+-transporting ATPase subunit I